MKIVPTAVEQQVNRVDRQPSLAIGISAGLVALWSFYRVLWSLYLSVSYNFLFGSLVFGVVFWGVIGAVATIAAIAFLTRYRTANPDANETNQL
jgi:hypothetical protein